jgi:iron only hydrogenase large subunit-like protein
MSFSSAVILTDLNDFIAPSQACIKPVEAPKTTDSNAQLKVTENGEYYQVEVDGTQTKLEKASITLNDCLACRYSFF